MRVPVSMHLHKSSARVDGVDSDVRQLRHAIHAAIKVAATEEEAEFGTITLHPVASDTDARTMAHLPIVRCTSRQADDGGASNRSANDPTPHVPTSMLTAAAPNRECAVFRCECPTFCLCTATTTTPAIAITRAADMQTACTSVGPFPLALRLASTPVDTHATKATLIKRGCHEKRRPAGAIANTTAAHGTARSPSERTASMRGSRTRVEDAESPSPLPLLKCINFESFKEGV